MKKYFLFFFLFLFFVPSLAQFKSVWDNVPSLIKNKNAFKRYEWFYRPRTDETGRLPKEHIDKQRQIEEAKILEDKNIEGTSDEWTNIGPTAIDLAGGFISHWGMSSGRIRGLDVSPSDPNLVYVGGAAGGIWKTTDGGVTWTDKSAGLTHLTFGSIAIDPNNTQIVYAGTGETMWLFNNITFEGDGLYKTTNGGNTWTKIITLGTQTQFSDIKVNQLNSNIILAALGSGNWNNAHPNNEGIWRSSDAGVTWTRVLNVQDAFDVAFHPTNPSLAYASSGNETSACGFFISTDGGITWNQSNTGLPSPTTIGRIQFDLCQSSPTTMYSLIFDLAPLSGGFTTVAYKSTNGGGNWFQISSGINIAGSYGGDIDDQGWYDLCLAVNPADPNTTFFANVELSKTTNGSSISFHRNPGGPYGGTSAWDGYSHVDIHKIVYALSNPNIIYLGCDGGVYKSTNAGTTWLHVNNGINTIQFYRVASHPTNPAILFGGAQDNGNFSTADKGATSWKFEMSGDGMECFIDYADPNYVFMSTQYGRIYRSTNAGLTWTVLFNPQPNCAWTSPYWQHPTNPLYQYAMLNKRLARTTNRGISWVFNYSNQISPDIITSAVQSPVTVANMMAISSWYTSSPFLYKSTNEGLTWSSITTNFENSGFTGRNIQSVIADPVDANTFYVTRASYTTGMVVKTTDFGATWIDVSGNIPSITVNDLFIDPANTAHLYAANDFGVYWTYNGGITWRKLDNGMPFVPVMDFSFYSYNGTRYLRAATHGRGVYELNIDTPLPVEITSFTASAKEDGIILNWSTASELNNYGFEVERSRDDGSFIKIGFVEGTGTSNSIKNYSFIDENSSGFLSYRLKQIDIAGSYRYSNVIRIDAPGVSDFALYQNYPNPFNPNTSIKFKIPVPSNVKLIITNSIGQELTTVFMGEQEPGIQEFLWEGQNYASGVYFASIYMNPKSGAAGFNKTIKMILNK